MIRKIVCIQMNGEFPDFTHRLVMPDYGLPLIGTLLAKEGYDVRIFIEHVQPPNWDAIRESDLVCFSTLNAGADKVYKLADRIRAELGIPTVLGGTNASYYPEAALEHCDYVVFGEGDETIIELVATLSAKGDPAGVRGIAFRNGERTHRTPSRPGPERFDTGPDFRLIEGYKQMTMLDMLRQRRRPLLTAQSSRGCQFKCTFCIVNTMFPTGYRKRDIESVIADLRDKRRYGSNLMFVDNDFTMKRKATKQLLRRIIEEQLGYKFVVFARTEIARDKELLELMREAGVTCVYQGYESIRADTLDAYDKHQTLEQIETAISTLHGYGFQILGSFVVGADTDTLESLRETREFVRRQKLTYAYFFPIWGHYPEQMNGYRTIVPWYRSIFHSWKHSDGNFVTHYPLHMSPSRLQQLVIDAYDELYGPMEIARAIRRSDLPSARGKFLHWYSWQRVRKGMVEYLPFLQEIESGLYDEDGTLREEALLQRVSADPRWSFREGNRTVEALGLTPLELPVPRSRNITCLPPKFDSTAVHADSVQP
ncbi:radical SAM protein [Bradyrhizobium sp. B117]|uniref:B12-binding domain-containing radical SAM protein n=1 Tax=Bradyrhizobium sp. B117 TaxID=3140246 RepID=UPI0031845053